MRRKLRPPRGSHRRLPKRKRKVDAWDSSAAMFLLVGVKRWLPAASRVGGDDATEYRAAVVKEAASFTARNAHVIRPAIAPLSPLEGTD